MRVPWITRRSILKGISPEYSLEGLMLKLKLQYFGHLMRRTDSLEKTLMLGKIEGGRRPGFDPSVGKIPWRRKWQLTPVFLPGESHGLRSLVGYRPPDCKSGTLQFGSVQFISVNQLCLTLCDPMNLSTSGLPVHHQLLELTQIRVL